MQGFSNLEKKMKNLSAHIWLLKPKKLAVWTLRNLNPKTLPNNRQLINCYQNTNTSV